MKRQYFRMLMAISVMAVFFSGCQGRQKGITISNSSPLMRVDEPVIITREALEDWYGTLPSGRLPVLIAEAGDTLAVQHDDMDGDGLWDEMVVLITMAPESAMQYSLAFVAPALLPQTAMRTNVRFARIQQGEYIPLLTGKRLGEAEGLAGGVFQMEGPAWENDRVAFRNYFDVRNGMDIFGKTTKEMVLDRVGIGEDYHFKQDWGQDILRVGTSLGSGSLALVVGNDLHRVAPGAQGYYALITSGPLRSTLRFTFDEWIIEGQTYSLVHDIDIFGGGWYYQSRISLPQNPGNARIAAGITTIDLPEKDAHSEQIGGQVAVVATHGPQAYDYEQLGMAIMLDKAAYTGHAHTQVGSDIPNTFLVEMAVPEQQQVSFRFYACWDYSEPRFASAAYFYEFLGYEGMKMANPLEVVLK